MLRIRRTIGPTNVAMPLPGVQGHTLEFVAFVFVVVMFTISPDLGKHEKRGRSGRPDPRLLCVVFCAFSVPGLAAQQRRNGAWIAQAIETL